MRSWRIWLVVAVLAGVLATACSNGESQVRNPGTAVVADTDSVIVPVVPTPAGPKVVDLSMLDQTTLPLRPESEREQVIAMWEQAVVREQSALETERLRQWLGQTGGLTDAQYSQLDTRERLALVLFHPEESADEPSPDNAAAGLVQRITRKLPADPTGTYSDRQIKAVYQDTVAIRSLMVELVTKHKAASPSMLRCITWFKANKAVPALAAAYRGQPTKDYLLVTTMVELLERNNYWPWFKTAACKGLLLDAQGVIPVTDAYVEEVLSMAQRFAGTQRP